MLSIKELQKYDTKSMHSVYDEWPKIAQKHFDTDIQSLKIEGIDHFVFAGMGGSGTIGDMFSAIFSKTNIPVTVVKGYHLPKTITKKTLVITTSVSGNTVETLNILKSAKESNVNSISFASGGKIEEYCKKYNLEFRKVRNIHSPRASFPAYLYTMVKILKDFIPIQNADINESLEKLKECKKIISSHNLSETNHSLNLAKWISQLPVIYYPWGLQAAAIRFKNSLQENSKKHSISEDIIEASHNGIVPWEYDNKPNPILIQGADDFIKTKERWKIIKEFFESKVIKYKEIHTPEGNILTKLVFLIYLLDYTTIYRAVLSGIDPSPVNAIDFIKNKL